MQRWVTQARGGDSESRAATALALPTDLQAHAERLSGVSLHDVRVHYASPEPAPLQAFAFTRGPEIHLAPGQERHLAHETWHVVQQKQGRVRPTHNSAGVAINDDASLEREADLMGAQARMGDAPTRVVDNLAETPHAATSTATHAAPVVQRVIQPSYVPQAGNFYSTVTQNFYATREEAELAEEQFEAARTRELLSAIEYSAETFVRWFHTPLADKTMTASRKYNEQLLDLPAEDLPENFFVFLESYFRHTAGFDPIDHQGRDREEVGKGGYFRSTDSTIKSAFRKTVRDLLTQSNPDLMFRKTSLLMNQPLLESLQVSGKVSSNLSAMNRFQISNMPFSMVGVFKSSQGSHIGSLGLVNNSMKMLRAARRLTHGETLSSTKRTGKELQELAALASGLNAGGSEGPSYHDTLLADRGRVIREITAWIHNDPWLKDQGIRAIQSENHASLILYHHDYSGSSNEKEWRETFLNFFAGAARTLNYQTRLNYRGSFGFLHPTASSVGGPVRIWPGVAPASVLKEILRSTLYNVDARLREKHGILNEEDAYDAALKTPIPSDERTPLHIETLKAAVRYTDVVLRAAESRPGNADAYQWLLVRLKKNLLKARFLLNASVVSQTLPNKNYLEKHYLKSALVIENLMEYASMLSSMTRGAPDSDSDPYLAYASRALLSTSGSAVKGRVYYLDSGMQAIVSANLLARTAAQQEHPSVLDVNTYFEYATIIKGNLQLRPFDSSRETSPDIISADLNPVFTGPEDELHPRLSYKAELDRYADAQYQPIPILDITNASLTNIPELTKKYRRYIVVESLTKHHQLGSDKYTMGRLIAVGDDEFLELSRKIVGPIATDAYDPLLSIFRRDMDEVFYGKDVSTTPTVLSGASSGSDWGSLSGYYKTYREQVATFQLSSIQSLLHANNCLINAVARAALRRNANLAELVEIRTQVERRGFPIGSMLVASPNILNIIRQVLGVARGIIVYYQGSSQAPDEVPGVGQRIVIEHSHAHFQERRIVHVRQRTVDDDDDDDL